MSELTEDELIKLAQAVIPEPKKKVNEEEKKLSEDTFEEMKNVSIFSKTFGLRVNMNTMVDYQSIYDVYSKWEKSPLSKARFFKYFDLLFTGKNYMGRYKYNINLKASDLNLKLKALNEKEEDKQQTQQDEIPSIGQERQSKD